MDEKEFMIHLVSFNDYRMSISAQNLARSAVKFGVHNFSLSGPDHLPDTFIQMAKPTIDVSKGAGLYIWKPFVIWEYMEGIADGDILIYADAGQTFVSNVQSVINSMDQDIMMFSNGWKHVEWCKSDVYSSINPFMVYHKWDEYKSLPQTQASLVFFKVTTQSRDFVKEWMLYALMPGFCDDSQSKMSNVSTFSETRWDQSILCCLQIKYGYRLHWFPTLTAYHIKAEYPNDKYPAIVDHHRKRNDEW